MRFIVDIPAADEPADTDPVKSDALWLSTVRESLAHLTDARNVRIDDRPAPMDFIKDIVSLTDGKIMLVFNSGDVILSNSVGKVVSYQDHIPSLRK